MHFSPSSSPKCPDRLWGPPSLLFNGYRDSLPGVVRPGREADHSPSPSAEVKNEWSYTSSTFIAWTRTGSSYTFFPLRTGYTPRQPVVERPEPTFLPRTRETKFHLIINNRQYRVLVGKPEGKRPLGRPRRRWKDNIKMDIQGVRDGDMDWIEMAKDRWRALVNAVMNLRFP